MPSESRPIACSIVLATSGPRGIVGDGLGDALLDEDFAVLVGHVDVFARGIAEEIFGELDERRNACGLDGGDVQVQKPMFPPITPVLQTFSTGRFLG